VKRQIRRWWFAGFWAEVLAFAVSLVLPVLTKPDRVLHGHARLTFSLLITCLLVAMAGVAVQVAAWLKALSVTKVRDAGWYRRLRKWGINGALLTPFLGLGAFVCWSVMLDYLRNGPDAIRPGRELYLDEPSGTQRRERV
jgi:hypothetical protein